LVVVEANSTTTGKGREIECIKLTGPRRSLQNIGVPKPSAETTPRRRGRTPAQQRSRKGEDDKSNGSDEKAEGATKLNKAANACVNQKRKKKLRGHEKDTTLGHSIIRALQWGWGKTFFAGVESIHGRGMELKERERPE